MLVRQNSLIVHVEPLNSTKKKTKSTKKKSTKKSKKKYSKSLPTAPSTASRLKAGS